MRRSLAALLLTGLLAAPAAAQPAVDPAALDLARTLMAQDASLYGDSNVRSVRARIANMLLEEPGSCEPSLPDCQAAATDAVGRFAPQLLEEERTRQERINAMLLADALRPEEMVRFTQFLRSPEGARLVMALGLLRNNEQGARRRRELERTLARNPPAVLAAARAEFRRNSRNIRRAAPR